MHHFDNFNKALFTLLIFIGCLSNISAQCNPAFSNFQPAASCFEAAQGALGNGYGFVCELDGFCFNTSSIPQQPNPIPFCTNVTVLDNPLWISFVADQNGILDLTVITQNCNDGSQWAIYDQCGSYFNPIACSGAISLPPNTPFNIYTTLTPGELYYLVIDGINGSSCTYQFKNNNSSEITPVGAINDSTFYSQSVNCNQTNNFLFSGFKYANKYEWTINGDKITTDIPQLYYGFYNFLPGIYSLCVKATNQCDDVGKNICWDIEVIGENVEEIRYICPGDSVDYQGTLYAVGVYDSIPYSGSLSCISSVNLTVSENDVPEDTIYSVVICPDKEFLIYNGKEYFTDTIYEEVDYETTNGCSFKAGMNISKLDYSALNITTDKVALPCANFEIATLELKGQLVSANEILDEKYQWTNEAGNIVGNNRIVEVVNPGTYKVQITSTISNPVEVTGQEDYTTCINELSLLIANKDSTIEAPQFGFDVISSGMGLYGLALNNFGSYLPGTEFIWIVPPGINFSVFNEGYLKLTLPLKGTYEICLQAKDPCGTQSEGCYTIVIDEDLSIAEGLIYGIKLVENPVSNIVTFEICGNTENSMFIRFIDIRGNSLYQGQIINPKSTINFDISNYPPGIYFYEFINKEGYRNTGKFIKLKN